MNLKDQIMDAIDTLTSEEGVATTSMDKEIPVTVLTPTDVLTTNELREDIKAILKLGQTSNTVFKSLPNLESIDPYFPTNSGDGKTGQRNVKSNDAIPSTSKVVVKKKTRKSHSRIICEMRQILPRKSKEKAKKLLKAIAEGKIPQRIVVKKVDKRSKKMQRPINVKRVAKKKIMRKSLQTLWMRDRSRKHKSRTGTSWCSDKDCSNCCHYNNNEFF